MLGFIMSKMNMLIFAAGIFVVAVLFYGFISGMDLNIQAQNILRMNSKIIEQQVAGDALCSFQDSAIPDRLTSGLGLQFFFYEIDFDKRSVSADDPVTGESSITNYLIMSIKEHNKKTSIVSVNVPMKESIVFVDPGFISEDKPIGASYDVPQMTFYPRSAKTGVLAGVNAFVALREIRNTKATMYIIPCSTQLDRGNNAATSNCRWNIVKTGCHILSLENPKETDTIPSCFNINLDLENNKQQTITWKTCKEYKLVDATS